MPCPRPTNSLVLRPLLALVLLLSSAFTALAVPPAAPTGLALEFTRYGFPFNIEGTQTSNSWYCWYLTWQDNALDEDGYHIQVRFGNAGPFFTATQLAANSSFARVSTGIPVSGTGTEIQFKVIPWKFNGASTESSETVIRSFVPARDNKSALTAPTALTVTSVDKDTVTPGLQADDGRIRLTWSDNSNAELYHRLRMRESGVNSDAEQGWLTIVPAQFGSDQIPFNKTEVLLSNRDFIITNEATPRLVRLQLIPGKTYEFEVGAGNTYGSNGGMSIPGNYLVRTRNAIPATETTAAQPATHFTVPVLQAPSLFSASPLGEAAMQLTWMDNSNNETGYEVQYRRITAEVDPPWVTLGTVGENVSSVTLPIIQTAYAELRVRAQHAYRPTNASTDTVLYSAYSETSTANTEDFNAPSGLTATTSGVSRTIDLTWTDNSASEVGFNIYCRAAGTTGAYLFCRATPENVTKVSVNTYTNGSPFTSNTLSFLPLVSGSAYEFVVRAVGNQEDVESINSNSVTAVPRHGFTSRLYQPIQQGQPFTHTLEASDDENITRFEATGLPPGLSISQESGLISGTPEVSDHFPVQIRAVYEDGHTAQATLDLRVLPALAAPALVEGAEVGDRKLGLNDTLTIPLSGRFTDQDTKAAVRMTTTKGNLDIGLFIDLTPEAIQNFINYAANGDYNNMAFHRLDKDFVLQGGFLRAVSPPRLFTRVSARPSPPNEPGISNLFGTIAAAKVGERTSYSRDALGQLTTDSSGNPIVRGTGISMGYVGNPDSASIDFFFNLNNNSTNLDNQNGGFTAFGRVGTPGLALLQQINQLPRGSYQNNNTGSTYNADLDKRIIIDGSYAPLSNIPMDAATAPADMDTEKTIRVTSIQPLPAVNYSVDAQATDIASAVIEGTNLIIKGLAAGTRPITITARDIDGNTATTDFDLVVTPGYKRPVITKQPTAITAKVNASVRYSVTATGTSLGYRWRKNGTIIPGQNGPGSPTFPIQSAQVSDEGEYDVIVFNEADSVFSNKVRLDIVKAPVITGTLPNKLVEVGSKLELAANLTEGSPTPVFTWKRGVVTVPKQTTKTLSIASATLADAGIYQATAKNSVSTASTTEAVVIVIDKRPRLQVEPPGSTVRLVAQVAGPDLLYQWYQLLEGNVRQKIEGAEDAVHEISNANPGSNIGNYFCEITLPPGIDATTVHDTGIISLAISGRPQIADTLTLTDGIVGANYNSLPNYGFSGSNNAISMKITGLPAGLSYDTATGRIFGRPTKPGNYSVKFTATNKSGTSPAVTRPMRIYSMGNGLSGTFMANVEAGSLNENRGGRVTVSVTGSGSFTAALQLAKDQLKGTGSMVLVNTVSDANGNTFLVYQGRATIPRRGRASLTLAFQIVESAQSFSGIVSDGTATTEFQGYRQIWSNKFRQGPLIKITSQRFSEQLRHNVLLSLPDTLTSRTDLPQGNGYLSATVSLSGTLAIAGRMADGTRFTASSIVSPFITEDVDEEGDETRNKVLGSFFQMLNSNTASVMGDLEFMISDRGALYLGRTTYPQELPPANHVKGTARWIKGTQPASDRYYRAGFEAVTLNALGALYEAPRTNRIIMNLPNVAGNAVLDFTNAGIDSATPNPDLASFRITTAHVGVVTGANDAGVKLSINPATGLMTGSFTLADKRKGVIEGLCIPASESEPKLEYTYRLPRGGGFFHLPETTAAKAPFLSGRVALKTPTIVFTTQPTPVVVNPPSSSGPATSATFTAIASGMPGLNYQWFLNGTQISNGGTITGADTTTLTITNPALTNEGSYTCVAFSGSISVPSNPATLTIRKPVSTVTLARSPSTEAVAKDTQVTFTATPNGNAEFTYQWFKDDVLIDGQTGPTYTFTATMASEGSYKVKVRNDLNETGVFISSTAVELAVLDPVTTVTLERSPDDEILGAGTSVTFTATSDGSGEKTYSWYKGSTVVHTSTTPEYSIDVLDLDDSGTYKVRVTQDGLADHVDSNEVELQVADLIHSVVLSRTPEDTYLLVGTSNVTFNVTSQGGGSLKTYTWRRGTEVIQTTEVPAMTLSNLQTTDSGNYTCTVTSAIDPEGAVSGQVALQVLEPVTEVLLSLESPASVSVEPGASLQFKATPSGSPDHAYEWLLDGETLTGVPNQATVTLTAPDEVGSYTYEVKVTNPVTSEAVKSAPFVIHVTNTP